MGFHQADARLVMKKIRETFVPEGEAALWWLGQMGLLIKTCDTLLCIDHYATDIPERQVPPTIPMEVMEGVDFFFGTHDHSDHIDHPAWRVWKDTCPGAKFVIPAMHKKAVMEDGIEEGRIIGLEDGESISLGRVTVHALAAAHEFLLTNPAPALQYVLEAGGLRIYHAGDTLRYEGMLPKLKALGKIDFAILPINGRDAARYKRDCIGNMTFQEAADLAGELSPGLVMPGHWDMFKDNSADPEAFAEYLEVKYQGAVPCKVPTYLEEVRVKR